MEAFLVSMSSVAIAEMGDRTQLLSPAHAGGESSDAPGRFWPASSSQRWPIMRRRARTIGVAFRSPSDASSLLDGAVGASMIAMALWTPQARIPWMTMARNWAAPAPSWRRSSPSSSRRSATRRRSQLWRSPRPIRISFPWSLGTTLGNDGRKRTGRFSGQRIRRSGSRSNCSTGWRRSSSRWLGIVFLVRAAR